MNTANRLKFAPGSNRLSNLATIVKKVSSTENQMEPNEPDKDDDGQPIIYEVTFNLILII